LPNSQSEGKGKGIFQASQGGPYNQQKRKGLGCGGHEKRQRGCALIACREEKEKNPLILHSPRKGSAFIAGAKKKKRRERCRASNRQPGFEGREGKGGATAVYHKKAFLSERGRCNERRRILFQQRRTLLGGGGKKGEGKASYDDVEAREKGRGNVVSEQTEKKGRLSTSLETEDRSRRNGMRKGKGEGEKADRFEAFGRKGKLPRNILCGEKGNCP